jgi:uncharacterized protein YcbK (DUF882 family)
MANANVFTFDKVHDLIPGSKYFKWSEALWLPQLKSYADPSLDQQYNIIKLATALDRVRDFYGKPIRVTSWLRPDAYNKMIGGAPFSFHKSGAAVDFVVVGLPCQQVKTELEKRKDIWPYRGERDTVERVHLDLGGDQWFNGPVQRKTV